MRPFSDEAEDWLLNGESGLSSACIFNVTHGVSPKKMATSWSNYPPADPADLRRCVLLLQAVPDCRENFQIMRQVSKHWNILVEHWDELTKLLEEEMAKGDRAPKTYDRMKELEASLKTNTDHAGEQKEGSQDGSESKERRNFIMEDTDEGDTT